MRIRGLRWLSVGLVLALALAVAVLLRPVAVRGDGVNRTVWLWAWQSGSASFTNSVTHASVRIDFGLIAGFDRFRMATDEKTEHYYTHGSYDINDRLAGQRTDTLRYCSMIGITVQLGRHRFEVADGCLEMEALWPPRFP